MSERRFIKQVTSTVAAQVLAVGLSIGTAAVIARWLGPAGKGMLSLSFLIVGLLSLFLGGGLGVANAYFAGSRRLEASDLSGASATWALAGTGVGACALVVGAATGALPLIMPGVPLWLILGAALLLPIALLSNALTGILQGWQRIFAVNGVQLLQAVLAFALTVIFIAGFGLGLVGALIAAIAAGAIAMAVLAWMVRPAALVPRWDPQTLRSVVGFGLRGHLGNLLQFFNYRLDMFVLNYFWGAAGVGMYGAAVALAELLWHLPNAVGFVILPRAAASRPAEMNAFTPRVFLVTLGLTAAGAVGLAVVGRAAITAIYSAVFVGAYPALLALLPGVVLLGGAKVLTNEIAGRGYPHYNAVNAGIALVLTVVLDLVLIPRYGLLGAAVATSIAYGATFGVAVYCYVIVSRQAHAVSAKPVVA